MTESAPSKNADDRRRAPWKRILAALGLLLLLLLLLRQCDDLRNRFGGSDDGARTALDSLRREDSLARLDSLRLIHVRDSLDGLRRAMEDSLRRLDSLARIDSLRRANRKIDTAALRRLSDSLQRARWIADSLARLDSLRRDSLERARRALRDTIPPYIFADPAAGVHAAPVQVAVLTPEGSAVPLCGPDTTRLKECRDMIPVSDRLVLWISGRDTAGNVTRPEHLEYVIDPNSSRCGKRRALVPTDSGDICVDAYEFPNDPALLPRTTENWEEASALCAKEGKRLCSAQELNLACRGANEWAYPYGPRYLAGRCQDVEGSLARGVGKPGCRSWWGAFHLVGNAWEWTSTPSGSTFFASGGTYTGGPEDKCGRTTRSFFRQNRYEALGFRCCQTLSDGK